ncbi:uncharacterized protein RHO25_001764 [Cercospora beticola]|uniref:Uncharacterized protein n=1 Tax=Cercospora beticola TaxID=122368 RepID=A0ABZ0NCE3_CERBT|nr:hypothetical protein RHO25_001764 [Cercospora beticola]CAK1354442.1 unnamed protein product [Cercospora beticola]
MALRAPTDWRISLDAAGLVALADLSTLAKRTALTGTSSLLDMFVIAPGLHRQQTAVDLNHGEYPACAAMTTGYVFRVENQAMVFYLQKVGKTGHLTTLEVSHTNYSDSGWRRALSAIHNPHTNSLFASSAYLAAVLLTICSLAIFVLLQDWWALGALGILIFARACNVFVVRQRSRPCWFGAPEPNEKSDLLILLSQDRWVRMKGPTDDVKAVTSGTWLQDPTATDDCITALATLLVYLVAALAGNARQEGKLVLLGLLFGSVALIGIANSYTGILQMHGRIVKVKAGPKPYLRRRLLADELVKETGKKHWAMKLGMLPAEKDDVTPPTM